MRRNQRLNIISIRAIVSIVMVKGIMFASRVMARVLRYVQNVAAKRNSYVENVRGKASFPLVQSAIILARRNAVVVAEAEQSGRIVRVVVEKVGLVERFF